MRKHIRYLKRHYDNYFGSTANEYIPIARYSGECMQNCISILADLIRPSFRSLLDIGCGTGFPARIVAQQLPWLDLYLLDRSNDMIQNCSKKWPSDLRRPSWIIGDAEKLPFRQNQFDIVLSSCMIHLFSDITLVLHETYRVLRGGGILCIITADPDEMASLVFHRFFPRFDEVDRPRHTPIREIIHEVVKNGFEINKHARIPYEIVFSDKENLFDFVSTKPFSAFSHYSDTEFSTAFTLFRERISSEFKDNQIINRCSLDCIIANCTKSKERKLK